MSEDIDTNFVSVEVRFSVCVCECVYVVSSASSLLLFHTYTHTYTHTPYSFIHHIKKQGRNPNLNFMSSCFNTHIHTHSRSFS